MDEGHEGLPLPQQPVTPIEVPTPPKTEPSVNKAIVDRIIKKLQGNQTTSESTLSQTGED